MPRRSSSKPAGPARRPTARTGAGRAPARRIVALPTPPSPEWVCHVPIGFEPIAIEEIHARLEADAVQESPGEVLFTRDEPFDATRLRCSEVCFRRVLTLPSPPDERAGPYELVPAFERAVPRIREVSDLAEKAALGAPRTVRFVTRMVGHYPYPRQHLRDRVESQLAPLLGKRYRRVDEKGGLEIWVTAGRRLLTVDVRVSAETMRHRAYHERHREGALRPAVAACLVRYALPAAGDLFCDPFCGTGTIGLERSHYGLAYKGLLLGDRDTAAASSAALNFGKLHEPKRICRWDARVLPLADATVDCIVTNPPFGGKSRAKDLPGLYAAALREMARVLRPEGRLVLVVGNAPLLRSALESVPTLTTEALLSVELQGLPATVLRLRKSTGAVEVTSRDRTSRRSSPTRRRSSRGR